MKIKRTVSLIIHFSLHSRNRGKISIIKFPEVFLTLLILLNWLKMDVTALHLRATSDCNPPDRKRLCPGEDILSLQAPAPMPYWEPEERLAHQVSFLFLPLNPLSIPFPMGSMLSQGDSVSFLREADSFTDLKEKEEPTSRAGTIILIFLCALCLFPYFSLWIMRILRAEAVSWCPYMWPRTNVQYILKIT